MKRQIVAAVESRIDEVLAAGSPFKKGELVAIRVRNKEGKFSERWRVATFTKMSGGKLLFETQVDGQPRDRAYTKDEATSENIKTIKEGLDVDTIYKTEQIKKYIKNTAVQQVKEAKKSAAPKGMGKIDDTKVKRVADQAAAKKHLKEGDFVLVNVAPTAPEGYWTPGTVVGFKKGMPTVNVKSRYKTGSNIFNITEDTDYVVITGMLSTFVYRLKDLKKLNLVKPEDYERTEERGLDWKTIFARKVAKTNERAKGTINLDAPHFGLKVKDPVVINFIPQNPKAVGWYAGFIKSLDDDGGATFEWNDNTFSGLYKSELEELISRGLLLITPRLLNIKNGVTHADITKKLTALDGKSVLQEAQQQSRSKIKPVLEPLDTPLHAVPKSAKANGAKTAKPEKETVEELVKPTRVRKPKVVEEPVVEVEDLDAIEPEETTEPPVRPRKQREDAPARPPKARVKAPAPSFDDEDTTEESPKADPSVRRERPVDKPAPHSRDVEPEATDEEPPMRSRKQREEAPSGRPAKARVKGKPAPKFDDEEWNDQASSDEVEF